MAEIVGGRDGAVYFEGTVEACNEWITTQEWPEAFVWIRLDGTDGPEYDEGI